MWVVVVVVVVVVVAVVVVFNSNLIHAHPTRPGPML